MELTKPVIGFSIEEVNILCSLTERGNMEKKIHVYQQYIETDIHLYKEITFSLNIQSVCLQKKSCPDLMNIVSKTFKQ